MIRLTNLEFQEFKNNFHCARISDAQFRIAVIVELADGKNTGVVFIDCARSHAAKLWVDGYRQEAAPSPLPMSLFEK
jgi:hypothetical protein